MNFSEAFSPFNGSEVTQFHEVEGNSRAWTVTILSFLLFLAYYVLGQLRYHRQNAPTRKQLLPPIYPHFFPLVGNSFSFILDNANFLRRATTYAGQLTSSRIRVFGQDFYLFEDRETVRHLWKSASLSSPIDFYVHVLRYFFGMHERALKTYKSDNSGPFARPFPGSNVTQKNRVDYLTHEGFKRAFTGPGLGPKTTRYVNLLEQRLESLPLTTQWTEMPDLLQFFRMVHGAALLEVVFGPALSKVNPGFLHDIWVFDDSVALLARLVPSFLFPEPYRVRKRLHNQLKRWYVYARNTFHESCIYEDGDGDPYWGSELIRYQQRMYLQADDYDDDALAAADLALVWGTLGNAIPTTMLSVYHVFRDPSLLARVRQTLKDSFGDRPVSEIDANELILDPLLSSIQAETLRLYVNVCVMVSSPHTNVSLGRWWMPKGAVGLVSSGITHMDQNFWNTKDGAHPVGSFWADRFINDPRDPSSGPVSSNVQDHSIRYNTKIDGKPSFSLQGLEASWMPYGGGNAICPGRLLAKRVTLFTIALMANKFDIEISNVPLKSGSIKFGMGVDKPKKPIPFRIRKRVCYHV
ncbi:cytochrome P450 [Lojkania enalia]|uniref:Cytochrome P450 n=1 Tax=Lojkania enalia TaxID=147567 RepID=A0A9P4KFN9_9PLEO|nr:cytochrome P450 [Didymosphaeria enalia]